MISVGELVKHFVLQTVAKLEAHTPGHPVFGPSCVYLIFLVDECTGSALRDADVSVTV